MCALHESAAIASCRSSHALLDRAMSCACVDVTKGLPLASFVRTRLYMMTGLAQTILLPFYRGEGKRV